MAFRSGLVATALLLVPIGGFAQPIQGVYINLGGGYNLQDDEGTRPAPALGLTSSHLVYSNGGAAVGSVGYAFGNGFRVELEGDYLFGNTLQSRQSIPPSTGAGGTQTTAGFMVNTLFDMDIGSPYVFPYIGVGGGYQWTSWSNLRSQIPSLGESLSANGTAGSIAFQGIIGLSFPVPRTPGLSITAEYRYMGVVSTESFRTVVERPGGVSTGNLSIMENLNQTVLLGIRYAFNVPPPPGVGQTGAQDPPAVPAPAPVRTYLVFFDWDSAELNDRARGVINEAAQASDRVSHTRIEVNGYADRSGNAQYNRKLSWRRAEAVAAELVRDGVPKEAITVLGFGEEHPLVPTAAGIREPRNRRVEIIIK
ncbi:MAG: OmpA family protein [Acetobacteraceae bacterium]|nr:OmpA family protein [Acetobacteraceae bacterium]